MVEGLLPDLPPAEVVRALQAWTTLIGAISLELFGHWHNTILDPEAFFEETIASMAVTPRPLVTSVMRQRSHVDH